MITISHAILSNMLWLPKEELKGELSFIKEDLTFQSYFDNGEDPKLTRIYKQTRNWLGVPWYYLSKNKSIRIKNIVDKRSDGEFAIVFAMTSKPRDEGQVALIDSMKHEIYKGTDGFLLRADTAAGKTYLGIWAMHYIQKPALVIVHKSDIMYQWRDEILQHTNIPANKIGLGKLGSIDWKGKYITIALVHTASMGREPKRFYKYHGVVLYDEVDRSLPPQTFAPSSMLFYARHRIAMSATPTRPDGMHKIINLAVGGAVVSAPKGVTFRKMPSVVVVKRYYSNKSMDIPGYLDPITRKAVFMKRIEKDKGRNHLICDMTMRFYRTEGRRVVIVSERLLQLHIIRQILVSYYKVKDKHIGYYSASAVRSWSGKGKPNMRTVKREEQTTTATESKIILATGKMILYGTNIPDLVGLVMAMPYGTSKQLLGRIERYKDGKKQPIVVDIVDEDSTDALRWFEQRMVEYNARRLKVIEK